MPACLELQEWAYLHSTASVGQRSGHKH